MWLSTEHGVLVWPVPQVRQLDTVLTRMAGEVALEQVSPEISSVSSANQHSTTAPNLCVNRYATCLTKQHIITSSVFRFRFLSPDKHLDSHKEKSVLW
jgi:hypothetical protein